MFGLGFVLSFGYWTTNFAEVQRALSAKSLGAARRTPLIGAYPKIFIPAITIIPGLVALVTIKGLGGDDPNMEYNNAIPLLMNEYLPNGMLGLALVGLIAAFMAGVAANVSAFNTVVTYDLWEPYVKSDQSDDYYLNFGRIATVVGILIGIATALIASGYNNIMDYIQLLFSFFNAPLFATFIIGMFWKRMTPWAGFFGPAGRHARRGDRALRERVGLVRPRLRPGGGLLGRDRGLRGRRDRLRRRHVRHDAQAGRGAAGLVYGMAAVDEDDDPSERVWYRRPMHARVRRARPDRRSSASSSPRRATMPEDKFIEEAEQAEVGRPARARAANLFDVRRFIGGLFVIYGADPVRARASAPPTPRSTRRPAST